MDPLFDFAETGPRLEALAASDPCEWPLSRREALEKLPRALVLRCNTAELVDLPDAVRGLHHDGFLSGFAAGKRHFDAKWAEAQKRAAARFRDGQTIGPGMERT